MYGEEQRSHVGNLIAFRHLLEHLAKHEVEQQGDRRMKQQIYKMIAERVYVTYDPIQGEADESDRPKEVEGPGRLEESPYRRRGDGRIVENIQEIIVSETIEQRVRIYEGRHDQQQDNPPSLALCEQKPPVNPLIHWSPSRLLEDYRLGSISAGWPSAFSRLWACVLAGSKRRAASASLRARSTSPRW